ncbi:MFS transporter [Corynebacterium camporealensis]
MTTLTKDVQQQPQLSRPRRWAAHFVLSFALIAITTDMTILNVAIPQISADIQPTSTQQLWIIDAYSLVMAGMLISMASIGDRWGRRRMLKLGYFIIGLASFLVIFAESAAFLIALRVMLGFGAAMVMPSTLSMIRVIFTDGKERAAALSIWAAVAGLGAAVGPLLGGILLDNFSWQAAFLISVPFMVLALIGTLLWVPESKVPNPGRWDGFAALLSLVGMVALVWAIKEFGKQISFAVPSAWIAGLFGLALLTWFVLRCLRSDAPLIEMRLFTYRVFSAGIVAALTASFAMSAALLLLAQWLQLVNGATPFEAGLQLMPLALAAAVSSLGAPPLAQSIGTRATIALALVFGGAGLFYVGIQGEDLVIADIYIALVLVGAGMGALAVGSAMILGGAPVSKAGNASAMEDTAYEFGASLGIAILGSISSLMYRNNLEEHPSFLTLPQEIIDAAEDSLGSAVAAAQALDLPQLQQFAGEAFTESLSMAGLVGGTILLAVSVVVFFMTPKGTDITKLGH